MFGSSSKKGKFGKRKETMSLANSCCSSGWWCCCISTGFSEPRLQVTEGWVSWLYHGAPEEKGPPLSLCLVSRSKAHYGNSAMPPLWQVATHCQNLGKWHSSHNVCWPEKGWFSCGLPNKTREGPSPGPTRCQAPFPNANHTLLS